jgi:hypothetical protein
VASIKLIPEADLVVLSRTTRIESSDEAKEDEEEDEALKDCMALVFRSVFLFHKQINKIIKWFNVSPYPSTNALSTP